MTTTRFSRFLGWLVLRWFMRRLAKDDPLFSHPKTADVLRLEWAAWYLTGTRFDWFDDPAPLDAKWLRGPREAT